MTAGVLKKRERRRPRAKPLRLSYDWAVSWLAATGAEWRIEGSRVSVRLGVWDVSVVVPGGGRREVCRALVDATLALRQRVAEIRSRSE